MTLAINILFDGLFTGTLIYIFSLILSILEKYADIEDRFIPSFWISIIIGFIISLIKNLC